MSDKGGGIAAAATPIAGLIGSFLGYRSAKSNTQRTIDANRQMAEYQYQKDREFWDYAWNKTNEYNSPAAQMERLKAAGLNPNLIYGSGSATGGVASQGQLPKYNAPNIDYRGIPPVVDLPQALGMYQDFKLKQAQTDNVQAQSENIRARTAIELGIKEATRLLEYGSKEHDLTMRKQWDPSKAAILQNQAEASNFMTETNRAKLANIIQQNRNLKAQAINLDADALFKKYRNDWLKMGFTTSDNVVFRILAKMFGSSINNDWTELGNYGGQIFRPNR